MDSSRPPWRSFLIAGIAIASIAVVTLVAGAVPAAVEQRARQRATPAPQARTEVHISASEFRFSPGALTAPPGSRVTLVLDNAGTIEHNLEIPGTAVRLSARPGQSASTEMDMPAAGQLLFECSIPGHKEAGMQGALVVSPDAPLLAAAASTASGAHEATVHSTASTSAGSTNALAALPLPTGLDRLPLPQMAPPLPPVAANAGPALVHVDMETREVTALMTDGVAYHFWTFNGTVPGPMIRVRQGDTVEMALKNAPDSLNTHSINIHAATGPGGGASVSQTAPGDESVFRFQALHAGVYVYHCMTPMVGNHVANGMYGMVVVEPPGGLPPVDREFYMMQGDFYTQGARDEPGLQAFDLNKLLHEDPDYVVFNGSVGSLSGDRALRANVGERVRIFFGVGGPDKESSFHVVGESFDRVWQEGAAEPVSNVQTTLVPPGGATMVELTLDAPGMYMIEDHHISRLEKGAWAHFYVDGPDRPDVFEPIETSAHTQSP